MHSVSSNRVVNNTGVAVPALVHATLKVSSCAERQDQGDDWEYEADA
jgi:hypothetical protein